MKTKKIENISKILENKDLKYYKIENGFLFKILLNEKEKKEYIKNYYYYYIDGMYIFNFDYNTVKPFVLGILRKKKLLEDYNKKSLITIIIFLILFFLLSFLQFKNFSGNLDNFIKKIENEKKLEKNKKVIDPINNIIIEPVNNTNNNGTGTDKTLK